MRGNLLLTLIVSLMLCSLAMLEVPELLSLTDETSNDFSLPVMCQPSPSIVINNAPEMGRIATPLVAHWDFDPLILRPVLFDSLSPHHDLLHLLCIQRT